jgi:hypothetical protein
LGIGTGAAEEMMKRLLSLVAVFLMLLTVPAAMADFTP